MDIVVELVVAAFDLGVIVALVALLLPVLRRADAVHPLLGSVPVGLVVGIALGWLLDLARFEVVQRGFQRLLDVSEAPPLVFEALLYLRVFPLLVPGADAPTSVPLLALVGGVVGALAAAHRRDARRSPAPASVPDGPRLVAGLRGESGHPRVPGTLASALVVVRSRWQALLAMAASLGVLGAGVAMLLVDYAVIAGISRPMFLDEEGAATVALWSMPPLLVTGLLFAAAVALLVHDEAAGAPRRGASHYLAAAGRRSGALLWTGLLLMLGVMLGSILLVVGIILAVWWSLSVAVVAIEQRRGPAALGRSRELVRGHGLAVFGVLAAASLATGILGQLLGLAMEAAFDPIARTVIPVPVLVLWLPSLLLAPFATSSMALLYESLGREAGARDEPSSTTAPVRGSAARRHEAAPPRRPGRGGDPAPPSPA